LCRHEDGIVWGCGRTGLTPGYTPNRFIEKAVATVRLTARKRLALATGLLLAAAVLRLWQIASIPRGLWIDEAFFLLKGQHIAQGQGFPIYFTENHGIEPLFPYLCSVAELMLGPVDWAGRLITGWLGVIGVACVIRLAQDMFPGRKVWLFAGLAQTFFYWDINFSRFSNLPELTTVFTVATLAAFWHGARTKRRWAFPLAGLCMGLGLSAYAASRFIPLVFLCAWLAVWVAWHGRRRTIVLGGLVTLLTALLVYSPLIWFFAHNPNWFFYRFNETTGTTLGPAGSFLQLWEASLKTLSGLFIYGDTNWRHNLAGRPALDISQTVLFALGLVVALRRWRSVETWALLSWLLLGLSPSVFTNEAPHFGRTTMAIPAITLILGLGGATLWNLSSRRLIRGLVMATLGLSALLTIHDYFGRWAHAPELFDAFSGDQVQLVQTLQTVAPGATLYTTPIPLTDVPSYDYVYWTLEYGLEHMSFGRSATFDGNVCSVLPARTGTAALYAVLASDSRTGLVLKAAYPAVSQIGSIPNLKVYRIPAGQTAQVSLANSRSTDFGDIFRLRGYSYSPAVLTPGKQLSLTVAWEARTASATPYKVFVHLIGLPKPDGSAIYAQQDALPCRGTYSGWQPGELVFETYQLSLPQDLPPGNFELHIGWYNETSGERLPVVKENSQSTADTLRLEAFQVEQH
jgi:hypothetical protein